MSNQLTRLGSAVVQTPVVLLRIVQSIRLIYRLGRSKGSMLLIGAGGHPRDRTARDERYRPSGRP